MPVGEFFIEEEFIDYCPATSMGLMARIGNKMPNDSKVVPVVPSGVRTGKEIHRLEPPSLSNRRGGQGPAS